MILRWAILPHALGFFLGLLLATADSSAAVLGWGRDDQGQLGLKRSIVESAPVLVGDEGWVDGKEVVQVSNGGTHTLALTADGRVYAWGTMTAASWATGL
jgi:alpha-tubulin suppressor-like RCC1 family protein